MKAKCVISNGGYENVLKEGREYEITDIQDSVFDGSYYIMGIGEDDKEFACHLYRFDISKEDAEAYVVKHHSDWREENDS